LSAVLGFWLIRRITRPLVSVVEQAEAIGARRFVSIPEPRTLEFRRVARAMNTLSGRVKGMLQEEADRLEALRSEIQLDALTGLFTRAPFLEQLGSLLQRDDAGAAGVLAIVRVAPLMKVNSELGRERADRLLQAVAAAQQRVAAAQPDWLGGRLNGADFALLAAGEADALELSARLRRALAEIDMEPYAEVEVRFPMGVALYTHGESLGELLARVDGALAQAEQAESDLPVIATANRALAPDLASWRDLLELAFSANSFRLARYPVKDAKGALLHEECPMRMQVAGEWQPAGVVMPWLARLDWLPRFDTAALELILATLAGESGQLCLNLSAEAIADAGFRGDLVQRLRGAPALASRLWIDIPEAGAFREPAALRELCIALTPLGCRIGLEHAGRNFARIGELHDLGLSYLKVGAALVRGIDEKPGNQAFLRGLAMVCRAIGLLAIAEGVANGEETETLFTLGFNGVTGPGV
jgi:diguanylate cyclase (GGDEF)-like protein